MQQEAAFFRQNQSVDNAEHRVDRVRIGRLANAATSGGGVPVGAKIASPQLPGSVLHLHLNILVGRFSGRRRQLNFEFKSRRRGVVYKSGVTTGQHLPERVVLSMEQDRHATNFNRDGVARIQFPAAPFEAENSSTTDERGETWQ